MSIKLPKEKDNKPVTSYSQVSLWREKKSFNLGTKGYIEYIRKYLFGEQYPDPHGWAAFGRKVEDALEANDFKGFTEREVTVLKKVKTLPVYQKDMHIDYGDFTLYGIIDNCTEDLSKFKDFKTASKNSAKKYESPDYKQLHIYASAILKQTGKLPEEVSVCVIERFGNPFKGESLSVGNDVWEIEKTIKIEDIEAVDNYVLSVVAEISNCYKVFEKLNLVL